MRRTANVRGQRGDERDAPSSTGALEVRLFGGLALHLGERALPPLTSGRSAALLAQLALHRDDPIPRQRLAYVLWPDSTDAQARTNLRKTLHAIRYGLPELEGFIAITSRSVQWREDAERWIDLEAFEAHLALAETDGADAETQAKALRAAVDLYRGDLLPDVYDDWVLEAREQARDRYLGALARLASLHSRRGEHARAVAAAAALVRGDPLQESAHRLRMRVQDSAGDRGAAVRAYHECVATLRRELGVEPAPETTALYDGLVRRTERVQPADEPDARHWPGESVLVGREAEWQELTDRWRRTEAGTAQLVVISGEPGVGKTRLIEDLGAWCGRRGARVVTARSYATEDELGYGVAISWLRTLDRDGLLELLPGPTRCVLGRLLPELVTDRAADASLDPVEERRRLIHAITDAVTAADRPVLLVLDDAQWSDAHSVAAIHHLVRLDPPRRVLVAVSVTRQDLAEAHQLHDVIADLQRVDLASELTLDRLSPADSQALARALGVAVDDSALYADTEGIPLFIVETAHAAREGAHPRSLTPKLRAVVEARFRRCSRLAGTVAGVAATIGRAFTTALVREACQLRDHDTVVAFDELWRRGLIQEHGLDAYDFTHGKLREVAYDMLSPPTRQRHHLAVADALRRLNQEDLADVSGQVASHYERAGRVTEAVEWYQRAATEATRRYASDDTVRLLERARGLLGSITGDQGASELAIVTALPAALVGVDGFASNRVDEAQRRVAELSAALGVEVDLAVLRSMVMSRLCRRDFDAARAAAEELQASARRADDHGLLIESDYMLGIAAFWTGQLALASDRFETVVANFAAIDRREHISRFGHDPAVVCQSRLANTLGLLGRVDEAEAAREHALAMAIEAAHPYSRAAVTSFAALLSIDLDQPERVANYVTALGREEHLTRPNATVAEVLTGFVDVREGHVAGGIGRIVAVIERLDDVDQAPGHHACFDRVRIAAHREGHDAVGGLTACDVALGRTGSRLWEPEIRRARAEFLAATDASPPSVDVELSLAAAAAERQGAVGSLARIVATRRVLSTPA